MVTWAGQFVADNGDILEVDCVLASEGRAHGWYVDEVDAWRLADANDVNAPHVTLTDAERERLDEIIAGKSAEIDADLAQDLGDWCE